MEQTSGYWTCKKHGQECKSYASYFAKELNINGITPKDTDSETKSITDKVLVWKRKPKNRIEQFNLGFIGWYQLTEKERKEMSL
jgi:hypothetical protein